MTDLHTIDAAAVLRLLHARPHVLALGEPTHGEDVLLEVRNDLFRQLVEREGYRTIAIESDCLRGLIVDDYVTTGTGTLDEVMERGFSHGFGASAANRELVRWMRAHNTGRPAVDRVRFAGLDGPLEMAGPAGPREALTALHAYLADRLDADQLPCTAQTLDRLLGDDERWTPPGAMMDPSQSPGRTPEARELRLLADDLVALLDARTPQLIAASSRDAWDRARLYGRTATGLMRYHAAMADPSPGRVPRLTGLRTTMMAANLLALTERGPLLAHAHNGHLQRTGAGGLIDAHLREEYAVLGTVLGTIRHRGVDVPPPGTVEGFLYALPGDRYLVDPRQLTGADLERRVSPWRGYIPMDPADVTGYDGIVFVRDAPPR